MVGASVQMLLDPAADRAFVTPRYHGIEKAFGPPAGKIGLVEALPTPAFT